MMRPVGKLITPELARELLDYARPGNRLLRRKVDKYKNMMQSGKWINGLGTPIVYKRGILLDGRHRLTAISETGISYIMPVESDRDF